jgi:hypothetical protein
VVFASGTALLLPLVAIGPWLPALFTYGWRAWKVIDLGARAMLAEAAVVYLAVFATFALGIMSRSPDRDAWLVKSLLRTMAVSVGVLSLTAVVRGVS